MSGGYHQCSKPCPQDLAQSRALWSRNFIHMFIWWALVYRKWCRSHRSSYGNLLLHWGRRYLIRNLGRRRIWKSWSNLKLFAGFQIRIYRISFQLFHHCF